MAVWVVLFIYVTALISQNNAQKRCKTGGDCKKRYIGFDEDCVTIGRTGYGEKKSGTCYSVGGIGDFCNGNHNEDSKTQIYDLFSTCGRGLYCDGNYSTEPCKNIDCLINKVDYYTEHKIRCQKNINCKTGMDCQVDEDCINLGEYGYEENKKGECYPVGGIDELCNGNRNEDSDSQIYDNFGTCAEGLTCVGNYSSEPCTNDKCMTDKVEYYVEQNIRCQNISVEDIPDQEFDDTDVGKDHCLFCYERVQDVYIGHRRLVPDARKNSSSLFRNCTTGEDCQDDEDCINLGNDFEENKSGTCYPAGGIGNLCNGNHNEDSKKQIYDIFSTCGKGLICDGDYPTEPCNDIECLRNKVYYIIKNNIRCRRK